MSSASIEATVRELANREAIRDLARRYAHCVWQKDTRAAVDLFTEDGEMDLGDRPVIKGRDALRAAYERMLVDTLQPFVHNHVIDLHGESATGTCYLDLRGVVDGKRMIGIGHYDDRYARVGEQWKFRSRKLTMRYFVPVGESPAKVRE